MKMRSAQYVADNNSVLSYYELENDRPKLLLLHAQGTDSTSYMKVIRKLKQHYHIYLLDCYGHGKSSHNREKYHLPSIGNDIIRFIDDVIAYPVTVSGHSSGGLIAAYIAANCDKCGRLILEDPPFFSCVGDRRYNTFNYLDLSSVCHQFLNQDEEPDFVYYYFMHQYCWSFFPDDSREQIRGKLGKFARKYREKHPEKMLKVPFWPRKFLEGFRGLQHYDPHFGESFYSNSFHADVDYRALLAEIRCDTLFLKANTTIGKNGLLQGALSDEDLAEVCRLIPGMKLQAFDCGHGIHTEKPVAFFKVLTTL